MFTIALVAVALAADQPIRAVPPRMEKRQIVPSKEPPSGEQLALVDGDAKLTLFLPAAFDAKAAHTFPLTVHFHTVAWFAIQEHLRRGLAAPLLCFSPGEGSAIYQKFMEDQERLKRWIVMVQAEVRKRGAADATVSYVDIASFSAGYGAVRELLKSPEYIAVIRRVVLADSMYAGLAQGEPKRAEPNQIEPFVAFAKLAMKGEKSFCFTHSSIPTTYASTPMCADALIEMVGARRVPVEPNTLFATMDPLYPLTSRADVGNFHIWGYAGTDAQAHLTHVRHIADVWMALDAAEAHP